MMSFFKRSRFNKANEKGIVVAKSKRGLANSPNKQYKLWAAWQRYVKDYI